MPLNQKITPFLWFDSEAEDAANYYVSIFKNSKINNVSRYGKEGHEVHGQPEGKVMVVDFTLDGLTFQALNGGPFLKMSGGVSFVIDCKTQEEVDYFWEKLGDGGEPGQCGWINHDKFGVTWQVVPEQLGRLMSDPDPVKSGRVMNAMLKMTKIDIQKLQDAYDGK